MIDSYTPNTSSPDIWASNDKIKQTIRQHLAIALDTADLDQAVSVAKELQELFAVAKVGLQLFSAQGPKAVDALAELGYKIFLDLKLHDIPTTVAKACTVISAMPVSYLTLHTAGGTEMLKAAVNALAEGNATARGNTGGINTIALGVTFLTSQSDITESAVLERVSIATQSGCKGVVCPPRHLGAVSKAAPSLFKVVPGIRLNKDNLDDHTSSLLPEQALAQGADLLVIGRIVLNAPNPLRMAKMIFSACEANHKEI
ncbi:MAG: orotidine-5'-phosphate decarboxylase [Actinobacteria bacterium]|nr:orotidine-5'-phosphate decarboxylase [Actinomycetota bacterium]MCL6104744.1 orotidine-5'-phosphate decarboxylase [Actinomycetota bacterium]